jgi:glutamine cyclotransferase
MRGPVLLVPLLILALLGCDQSVPTLEYRVLRRLPHDPGAYTQGLVFHEGVLLESTGRRGESSVRIVQPETGQVSKIRNLPEEYFGEGLALVGAELVQLTWQSGTAFVYDAQSLELLRTFEYSGEGWGLCFDGESLYMSDGSATLTRRNPATFEILEEIPVTRNGFPVWRLNELECVGGEIFANIYQTDQIVRIDKASGAVSGEMDGYGLSVASRRAPDPEAVFNGIAYDPATGHFFVTGKLWPDLFEIEILGG